jgi:hypothetical protein
MTTSLVRLTRFAIRALLATSLILLQGLPSKAAPTGREGPAQIGYSAGDYFCGAAQDSKAPAQDRRDHAHNCVICAHAQDRLHAVGADIPPIFLHIPVANYIAQYWGFRPWRSASETGWSSAWSSRSPPALLHA